MKGCSCYCFLNGIWIVPRTKNFSTVFSPGTYPRLTHLTIGFLINCEEKAMTKHIYDK